MPDWISAKEQLPDINRKVIVHYESGRIEIDFRTPWNEFVLEKSQGKVTHWIPLPEPPKGE